MDQSLPRKAPLWGRVNGSNTKVLVNWGRDKTKVMKGKSVPWHALTGTVGTAAHWG